MRWLSGLLTGRRSSIILMYHRVADPPIDPWKLCVSPRNFEQQMEVIAASAQPVHLANVVSSPNSRRPRIAVTFDDGYADNLYAAKPVLDRFSVPTTIFVTTGEIGSQTGFWWDRLEQIFLHPGVLPDTPLRIQIERKSHTFAIDEADQSYTSDLCRQYRGWTGWKDRPPTSRHSAFCAIWKLLRSVAVSERERVIADVGEWARFRPDGSARCMNEQELRLMFDGVLVRPGAHTITHSRLSALPASGQEREIGGSRTRLREILSSDVDDFSYPFGNRTDYTKETVRIVAGSGFSRACAIHSKAVQPEPNPFELPRVHAPDIDGAQFERFLSSFVNLPT